jgi:RNA polymerase sigma factor (sigma-70 family)
MYVLRRGRSRADLEDGAVPEGEGPDRLGFEAVYQRECLAVVRLAVLLVRSTAVAEELAQEAFLRLYQRFAQVENPAGFVRHGVVDLAVTWLRRHDMERERLPLSTVSEPRTLGEPELDEMWEALGHLRPERRAVLVLRFYEDMSHERIAELLGCSAGTVRSRVRRALADLRKEMSR